MGSVLLYILQMGEMLRVGGEWASDLKSGHKLVIKCAFAMVFWWEWVFWWCELKC